MNRLKNTRAYLAGPIDRVADDGETWRRQIRHHLIDLDIIWLDPLHKPIDLGAEDSESRRQRRVNKLAGEFDLVADEMMQIRDIDIRLVNISDFLIVYIDIEVHAAGTYEELFLANSQNKPVLVCIAQGKRECPDWLLACLPHEHIFDTWIDLHRYLRHIANDKVIEHLGRWVFFSWTGE